MTIPIFYSRPTRQRLSVLLADGNTVADYQAGIGQTNDGAGLCSSWANQIGIAGALTAATTARLTIQSDGSLLFDGSANVMQTAGFTLAQPVTYYIVFNQITWTSGRHIINGVAQSLAIYQSVAPPQIDLAGTANMTGVTDFTVNTKGILTTVANGASSSMTTNSGTPVIGNCGTRDPGGITLGANNSSLSFSNILA